jgi:predicted acyl esterase
VAVRLRDGVTTIYADIFRPADDQKHPAIMAMSPYGKEIGSQWLDDTPNHAGIPVEATSGLQKFEGPDPAYWCDHGYAVINPDVRGAYNSEGVIQFFGSDYGTRRRRYYRMGGKAGMVQRQDRHERQFVAGHLAVVRRGAESGAPRRYRTLGRTVATATWRWRPGSGVPMPEFVKMLSDSFASTKEGGVEDVIACHEGFTVTRDAYWEDKAAELEKITVPAYIVASYTNPIHTYGTLEGYRRISSEEKWLRIHNTGEWDDYYNEAHTEDLRKFFDRYLKGVDNGWEDTPRVRVSV